METLWNDILEHGGPVALVVAGLLFIVWRVSKAILCWGFDEEKGYCTKAISAHIAMVETTTGVLTEQEKLMTQQANVLSAVQENIEIIRESESKLLDMHTDEREGTRFETVTLKRLARRFVKRLPDVLCDLGMDKELATGHADAIGNDFMKTAS